MAKVIVTIKPGAAGARPRTVELEVDPPVSTRTANGAIEVLGSRGDLVAAFSLDAIESVVLEDRLTGAG